MRLFLICCLMNRLLMPRIVLYVLDSLIFKLMVLMVLISLILI